MPFRSRTAPSMTKPFRSFDVVGGVLADHAAGVGVGVGIDNEHVALLQHVDGGLVGEAGAVVGGLPLLLIDVGDVRAEGHKLESHRAADEVPGGIDDLKAIDVLVGISLADDGEYFLGGHGAELFKEGVRDLRAAIRRSVQKGSAWCIAATVLWRAS